MARTPDFAALNQGYAAPRGVSAIVMAGLVPAADKCAAKALDKFKAENGYSAYEIVARQGQWFPSGYDYRVRFRR